MGSSLVPTNLPSIIMISQFLERITALDISLHEKDLWQNDYEKFLRFLNYM